MMITKTTRFTGCRGTIASMAFGVAASLAAISSPTLAQTVLNAPGVSAGVTGERAGLRANITEPAGGVLNGRLRAEGGPEGGTRSAGQFDTVNGRLSVSDLRIDGAPDATAALGARYATPDGEVDRFSVDVTGGPAPVQRGARVEGLDIATTGSVRGADIRAVSRPASGAASARISDTRIRAAGDIRDTTIRATAIGNGSGASARVDGVRLQAGESVSGTRIRARAVGNSTINRVSVGN